MYSLPYFVPDQDYNLNTSLLLLTLSYLSKTEKGRHLVNNERLLIYMYLIKNPTIIKNLLGNVGDFELILNDTEKYSVGSISINLDPLFDTNWIKSLLKNAARKGYIEATYRKDDGFMYSLTEDGASVVKQLNGGYLDRVRLYLKNLNTIKSMTSSNLNKLLGDVFRK